MAEEVPIRNYTIGQRLRDVANIASFPTKLSDVINPVVIVNSPDQPALVSQTERGTLKCYNNDNTFGGNGTKNTTVTVPNGYKWNLKAFTINLANTATVTQYQVIIQDASGNQLKYYDSASASTTPTQLNQPLTLPQGWAISFSWTVTADTNGAGRARFIYQEFQEAQ